MRLGKTKKIIALISIVLLFAAFAVGCGEVDDDWEELEEDFEIEEENDFDDGLNDGMDDGFDDGF